MCDTNDKVDLRAILTAAMEPTEPADSVLRYFATFKGQRFTKRNIDALNAQIPQHQFRLARTAGMLSIEWDGYGRGGGGGSLLCAYTDKNTFAMDPDTLRGYNLSYYDARDKRNAERKRLLDDERLLFAAQADLQVWKDARAALDAAKARVEEQWVIYGGPLHHDRYAIEKVCDPQER
jgi:hypothetical protein